MKTQKLTKFHAHLRKIGYGTVVRYPANRKKGKLYFFCRGLDEDVLMSADQDGDWLSLDTVNWKNYEIVFDGGWQKATAFV